MATQPGTVLVALAAIASLAGCAQAPARDPVPVDWATAKHVEVELVEYGYRPKTLHFKLGQPYRLTLLNTSMNHHYFSAKAFFASVDARKAVVDRYAEIKATTFTEFELFRMGGRVEIFFVPRVAGSYDVHCHIGNHREMGVEGSIVVD